MQAAPDGGRVRLSAQRLGEQVRLAVGDDGPGVPEADRARLFSAFQTTKEKGLGLGLALVRRVAQAHGGLARYDAGGPGATFVIEVPARSRVRAA